ncbi:unnamed protein product [Agarophyton chilense]
MPPRPPLTTLVIHTWKEHGKPKPFSNQRSSAEAAKERITRSISHEAHLAQRLNDEDRPQNCSCIKVRSVSYEDGLTTKNNLVPRGTLSIQCEGVKGSCAAAKNSWNSKVSCMNVKKPGFVDFSPVRVGCLPTIPELESLSSPAPLGVNASQLSPKTLRGSSQQSFEKKRGKVKLRSFGYSKANMERDHFQSKELVSLLERSCSFDADLSTIAEKGLELRSGISPNL